MPVKRGIQMNILIITTYYPPDTAIAAVRPYMFAKYLSIQGHRVTVIRSGVINKTMDNYYPKLEDVEVISYLGKNCLAEKFDRGEIEITINQPSGKSRISFLPYSFRTIASKTYHTTIRPIKYIQKKNQSKMRFELIKKEIDSLRDRQFDIVFSTYSEIENAYAGEYASKVFKCKWVMDFRDPIAQKNGQQLWEYLLNKRKQESIIEKADLCTAVSDELFMKNESRNSKIVSIHNGFDDHPSIDSSHNVFSELIPDDVLTFCYTGQLYGKREQAWESFIKAIALLINDGVIDRKKIHLYYAGNGADAAQNIIQRYHIEDTFTDFGYLPKAEVEKLQKQTDFFLVLSWNTKYEKGVLTGKFYEGLSVQKPIIAIVEGKVPNSELFQLNRHEKYGFCYETVDNNLFVDLCNYIKEAYEEKMIKGTIIFKPGDGIRNQFSYKSIAQSLESHLIKLLNDDENKTQ